MSDHIIISGASGFIGRKLSFELLKQGYRIIALTRSPEKYQGLFPAEVQLMNWDSHELEKGLSSLPDARVVINLAGENIGGGRWTRRRKEKLLNSRLHTTGTLVNAVRRMKNKPDVFIQMSAIGYYGDGRDTQLNESSPVGSGFLAELTEQWERTATGITELGIKLVIMRTGLVLGKGGGLLQRLTPAFRLFLGGHFGKGNQWMSWIHLEDVVGAFLYILKKLPAELVYNLTAPEAVQAREFFQLLGRELGRPSWLHVPEYPLKIVLGEMARETILISQKVYPTNLLKAGFEFKYIHLQPALQDIFSE